MQNFQPHGNNRRQLTAEEVLDQVSASYDLEIQKHQAMIRRLKEAHDQVPDPAVAAADFVIHPRRAA